MFFKAASLDLDDREPLIMVSKILQAQGKPDEAVKFLEGFVRKFPSSAELHTGLGLAYVQTGAEDKAVEEFSRAIKLDRFAPDPYVHLAAVMLSRNNPDEAIRLAGEATKLASRADAHNVLGAAYGYKGDHARALKHFLAAFKLYPDFPSLRIILQTRLWTLATIKPLPSFATNRKQRGNLAQRIRRRGPVTANSGCLRHRRRLGENRGPGGCCVTQCFLNIVAR